MNRWRLNFLKHILRRAAHGADPVLRQILKSSPGLGSRKVTDIRVVYITADSASILCHFLTAGRINLQKQKAYYLYLLEYNRFVFKRDCF